MACICNPRTPKVRQVRREEDFPEACGPASSKWAVQQKWKGSSCLSKVEGEDQLLKTVFWPPHMHKLILNKNELKITKRMSWRDGSAIIRITIKI